MCLEARKIKTEKFLAYLKKNKIKSFVVTKRYDAKILKNGNLVLQSPCLGSTVRKFGDVVSNRENKTPNWYGNYYAEVNRGIHVFANCPNRVRMIFTSHYDMDCQVAIPVTIKANDVIAVDGNFRFSKRGQLAAMKVHITRDTWRAIEKLLKNRRK